MGLIKRTNTINQTFVQKNYEIVVEREGGILVHGIFIAECILKIIAKGFVVHKESYLRDSWNILDFFVAITAIIEFLPIGTSTASFRGIRSIRAIRPLRSINAIPSMKKLVKILLKSLPNLATVVLLLAFMMLIITETPVNATFWPMLQDYDHLCNANDNTTCPTGTYCGHPADYNISLEYENISSTAFINYGVVQFDNIGTSFLTVFQVLTVFGWSDIMYNYMESNNEYLSAIFFSVLVLFGAFFLLNLILAVIVDAYNKIDLKEKKKEEEKQEEEAKKREKKFDALKSMYRMMRLSQKKKEIIESAGLKFRWSFFDVVFELVRVERYEKILNPNHNKNPLNLVDTIKSTFIKKADVKDSFSKSIHQNQNQDEVEHIIEKSPTLNHPQDLNSLGTIQENQNEDEEDEDSKLSKNTLQNQMSSSLNKAKKELKAIPNKDKNKGLTIKTGRNNLGQFNALNETNNFELLNGDETMLKQEDSFYLPNNTENQVEMQSPVPKQFRSGYIPPHILKDNSLELDGRLTIRQSHSEEIHAQKLKMNKDSFPEFVDIVVIAVPRKRLYHKAWAKAKQICLIIISASLFKNLMNTLIIANTTTMALDRYPIPDNEKSFENTANFIFYVSFVIELVLKLIGLGPKLYFKDGFNIFDAIIILISTIDVILNSVFNNSSSSTLSVLRGFRILRLLKIAKSQSKMQDFQQTIAKTLVDLRNFSILLVLVVFTYTLLSLDFFAYKMKFDENDKYDLENGTSPRLNFDGFANAFTTVFCILQGESYNQIMYNVARSVGSVGILFFVTLIVFGQIILLKLFLAVLLENFEDKRKEAEEMKKSTFKRKLTQSSKKVFVTFIMKYLTCKCCKAKDPYAMSEEDHEHHNSQTRSIIEQAQEIIHEKDRALFLFSHENKCRKFLIRITSHKYFEYAILVLIIASSIFTAIENPLELSTTTKNMVIYYCDIGVTTIFALEVILKIIAKGFLLNGPGSYLHTFWNILDFIIVLVSIISIFANNSNSNLKLFKVLRLIRVLRPLRVIGRNEGLKLAVQTLLMAIPNIMNVLLVSMIFYLIFGIFCVNFLKGRYYYCYTDQLEELNIDTDTILTKWDCLDTGGEWVNQEMNFDNTLMAMQLLYSMSSVSWNSRMFNAVDATYVNYAPIKNNNPWWILYFVIFMIIFAFFLLNLFVGVVVTTFNNEKARLGRNFLLTDTQKEWLGMKMMLLNTKPVIKKIMKTSNIVRRVCFKIIMYPAFEWFIFFCIITNTIILTLNWYNIPNVVTEMVTIFNYVFAAVFTIEAILKITALGLFYFRDNWNKFDFIIVIATILGIIIDQTTNVNVGGKATIARAFRVARLFRILKRAKVLKIITDTLIVSLPSLMNVGGLLFLILYIYSILGMQLFAEIKLNEGLNERSNFQTFGRSFLTLIKIATGEEWDALVDDMSVGYSILNQCSTFNATEYAITQEVNGCGNFFSRIYMLSFNMLVSVIFLNLFVAIVLQSFEEMNKKENKLLSDQNMDHLRHCWAEFDQEGTSFIEIDDFIPFLHILGDPLGFSDAQKTNLKQQDDFMKQLLLPTYNGMKHFYYYDVIQVLTQYAYLKLESERKLKQQLMQETFNFDKLTIEILNSIKSELEFTSEVFRAKEIVAFKEAMEKERNIYSKMNLVKDDLDSQHFWAGGRIKNMYGKTNMQFKGGNLQNMSNQIDEEKNQETEEVKEQKEGSEASRHTPLKDGKSLSFVQIRRQSTHKAQKLKESVTVVAHPPNNRRKSLWNALGSVIIQEDDEAVSLPILNTSNHPSLGLAAINNQTPQKKRSSILLPMIAKNDKRVAFTQSGKQFSSGENTMKNGEQTMKSGFALDNIEEEERSEMACSSSEDGSSSKTDSVSQSSNMNSDHTYNIYEHDKQHFKQPKQKQFHIGNTQKHQNFQLHPSLLLQVNGLRQHRRADIANDSFEHRVIEHSANRPAEQNSSSAREEQDVLSHEAKERTSLKHLNNQINKKRQSILSYQSGLSQLQQELEEIQEEEDYEEVKEVIPKISKRWTQEIMNFGTSSVKKQPLAREHSNINGARKKLAMKERISDTSLMIVEQSPKNNMDMKMNKKKVRLVEHGHGESQLEEEIDELHNRYQEVVVDDLSSAHESELQSQNNRNESSSENN